jgi:hypothetical protein
VRADNAQTKTVDSPDADASSRVRELTQLARRSPSETCLKPGSLCRVQWRWINSLAPRTASPFSRTLARFYGSADVRYRFPDCGPFEACGMPVRNLERAAQFSTSCTTAPPRGLFQFGSRAQEIRAIYPNPSLWNRDKFHVNTVAQELRRMGGESRPARRGPGSQRGRSSI